MSKSDEIHPHNPDPNIESDISFRRLTAASIIMGVLLSVGADSGAGRKIRKVKNSPDSEIVAPPSDETEL